MAVEVEIKAWVKDPDGVETAVKKMCSFVKEYRKEDVYFRGPLIEERSQDIRIRKEDDCWSCTFKIKTLKNGLEVNEENEFDVSDGEALGDLLILLGARLHIRKNKIGRSYRYGDLTIELSEVEGLGNFIEIERLFEGDSLGSVREADLRKAEADIRSFMALAGVSEEDVEDRPYTAMLLEAAKGSPH